MVFAGSKVWAGGNGLALDREKLETLAGAVTATPTLVCGFRDFFFQIAKQFSDHNWDF